ncbi:M48 family metallopeptidase [Psychrosphaera aestuarii]|uniref:M48 family metallopeptidase n=1 Tax=Psychrosphaera aestuarii TaxID=1266052 RepID=UPI001FD5F835|nr:YgjP-like metallopeptidase domain-containing protein [Psychrosphaera aestuarii]
MTSNKLKYISHYPPSIINSVERLLSEQKLTAYLLKKYPKSHQFKNDKLLRDYVLDKKSQHLKKSLPVSKVEYDNKLHVVKNALGTHTSIARMQGNKLKRKYEIRISSIFKNAPEPFLAMIVVHELAHFKEAEHNKAFYKLCEYMLPDYHQLELDVRLFLTHLELIGDIY